MKSLLTGIQKHNNAAIQVASEDDCLKIVCLDVGEVMGVLVTPKHLIHGHVTYDCATVAAPAFLRGQ